MNGLTSEEIEEFNTNGFLVKKKYYNEDEILEIRKWVYEYSEKKPEDWKEGQEMGYYEKSKNNGERILTRLENFVDYNKNFHNLVYSEKIMKCVDILLGEKCVFF